MVKISTRWKLAPDLDSLRGSKLGTKTKYLWRKGWTEIPIIMLMTPLSIISAFGYVGCLWYNVTHDLTPKYHARPTIIRPDDPRVSRIRYTSSFD